MHSPTHHTVIIVGGGPAGLGFAGILNGWHPWYRDTDLIRGRYPDLARFLASNNGSLLSLDHEDLVRSGVRPADLFRTLHHPSSRFRGEEEIALEFRRQDPVDWLMITREDVGGLWNNVPRNLLTLSPGHWMEMAFHPLSQHAEETGREIDPNTLIIKHQLIDYYHRLPSRMELGERVHTGVNVDRIEPHAKGFALTTREVGTGSPQHYTCRYLIYAAGQRCILRSLNVPGEELPFVSSHYDHFSDYPGERVVVIGGGRSADWAVTELHDAGRQVHYIMRQSQDRHWRLIGDSRNGLPYYARIAEILESGSPRLQALYDSTVSGFEENADGGQVTIGTPEGSRIIEVDHAIKEIGGIADYSILQGFPPIDLYEKYDDYRFQVHQMPVRLHSYESTDIPNLYPGGYLAKGLGLVVIGMHGAAYPIAADILKKEGRL